MRDYTKIEAWQLADDLAVAIYECTRCFPREEQYGITSQVRRAAVSVAANIAESSARESKRDYLHFLYIARGSLMETTGLQVDQRPETKDLFGIGHQRGTRGDYEGLH